MEPFEPTASIADAGALRPAPSPTFAAELDERAAAGFPRRRTRRASPLRDLLARLRALRPAPAPDPGRRRRAGGDHRRDRGDLDAARSRTERLLQRWPGSTPRIARSEPAPATAPEAAGSAGDARSRSPDTEGSGSGVQYGRGRPDASRGPPAPAPKPPLQALRTLRLVLVHSGPFAARRDHREVERSAEMVLGADPPTSAATPQGLRRRPRGRRHRPPLLRRGGHAGDAGASFELLIPSAKLGDALASFSAIATVLSRHEAHRRHHRADRPRRRTAARLPRHGSTSLLAQLAGADTDCRARRGRSRTARRAPPQRRPALTALDLQRRANLSRVSLRIETGAGSATDSGGSWGIRRRPRRRRPHPRHRRRGRDPRPRDPHPVRSDRAPRLARHPRLHPSRPRAHPRLGSAPRPTPIRPPRAV